MNGKTFSVEVTSPNQEFQNRTIDNVFIDGDVNLGDYSVNEIINGDQLYFDFNEDGSQAYSNQDITSPTGIRLVSLEDVPPEIIAQIVSDSTRVTGNLDEYGSFQFIRKATATHGTEASFDAYVNINPQDDLRGLVEDHQFHIRRGGIINIDGTDYVIGEDGQFDHQVAPKDTHLVVARQYQGGQPYSFKRTIDVPGNGDNNDILIRPTDYTGFTVGDTSGVTPEEYKLWVREINSDPVGNCSYFGFKKPDLDSTVVWIAYNDESGSGSTFTRAEQDTVEKYYRDVIFAQWLGREVPIYKEDPDNPESNPYFIGVRNVQLVQPNNTIPGAGQVGVRDLDYDGEIDAGFIALRTIPGLFAYAINQEGVSGFGAIGFPINSLKKGETITHEKTILSVPSVYDNKFGRMIGEETYKLLEPIDRILGL